MTSYLSLCGLEMSISTSDPSMTSIPPSSLNLFCSENYPKTIKTTLYPNNNMTLEFQELVANKCNKDFSKIGHMILDGTKSDPPRICWSGYILKNKRFPKASPPSLIKWISKISSSGHMKGGIIVWMDNLRVCHSKMLQHLTMIVLTQHEQGLRLHSSSLSGSLQSQLIYPSHLGQRDKCACVPGISLVSPPADIEFLTQRKESPAKAPTPTTNKLHHLHLNMENIQTECKNTWLSYQLPSTSATKSLRFCLKTISINSKCSNPSPLKTSNCLASTLESSASFTTMLVNTHHSKREVYN
ncbi:hypothetical protein VP01_4133g3 [Puccinia sorghi]|uniref:Uncharacterized protein n=1 Tax=Puccinia sorghi TaxID=27349 RepID=A0A0L6US00_9BASI|nr:hypothetical protein VP01_4133g3 [Puccinia sorghi]